MSGDYANACTSRCRDKYLGSRVRRTEDAKDIPVTILGMQSHMSGQVPLLATKYTLLQHGRYNV